MGRGKVGAARDAALLLATLPPEQIGPQVLRVSQRLGLDPVAVTEAVSDAISQDADAPGRLARRDRLDDLDRGQAVTAPESAAQLARSGFSARLLSVTTPADPRPPSPSRGRQRPGTSTSVGPR